MATTLLQYSTTMIQIEIKMAIQVKKFCLSNVLYSVDKTWQGKSIFVFLDVSQRNFCLFGTRFVRGNMDLCKSVSNNFDECSNQDSICDGGSMERTEAGARLKSIRGIWQNQPPMGFEEQKNICLKRKNI